jgi:hypothetical protein
MYHVTRRLYLTADGRVVMEGHSDASSLLYPAGAMVPDAIASRYGLTGDEESTVASPAGPPETRATLEPPTTRAVRRPARRT